MVGPGSSDTQSWQTGTTSAPALSWPALFHFLVCGRNLCNQSDILCVIKPCARCKNRISWWLVLTGNGDILSYEDAMKARETGVSGIMIARLVSHTGLHTIRTNNENNSDVNKCVVLNIF